METPASTQRKLANEEQREHIADLLRRYPQISPAEEAAILRFLKKAPAIEVGLLAADDAARPKLDQFKIDHAKAFTIGPKGLATAVAIIAAIVAFCVFAWNVGAGG